MSDLKPCPFCGCSAFSNGLEVSCESADCKLYTVFFTSKEWNKRTDDRLVEEHAELREMLQKTATAIYSHNNEMVGMHAVMVCAKESVELLNK